MQESIRALAAGDHEAKAVRRLAPPPGPAIGCRAAGHGPKREVHALPQGSSTYPEGSVIDGMLVEVATPEYPF
jgi:hypothetical protein